MIGFMLNIPYTIIGLIIGLISLPVRINFVLKSPYAIVLNTRKIWWIFKYAKNARNAAIGHVILLGPKVEEKDFEHELVHVRQQKNMPIVFPLFYFWQILKYGYRRNKYEVEAYQKAGNVCRL